MEDIVEEDLDRYVLETSDDQSGQYANECVRAESQDPILHKSAPRVIDLMMSGPQPKETPRSAPSRGPMIESRTNGGT